MSSAKSDGVPPPPYASYKSFVNFLDAMRGHPVLPSRIDKSVVSNLNYGTQAALLAALKSMQCISDDGRPLPRLEVLVRQKPGDLAWKQEALAALDETYPYIFDDGIQLDRISPGQLDEVFRTAANIKGSTVDKVVTFFLAIANDAGVSLSPHLSKRKSVGGNGPKRARAKNRATRKEEPEMPPTPPAAQPSAPDLVTRLVGKFPEFDPAWPDEIKAKWFEGFDRLMGSVTPPKPG